LLTINIDNNILEKFYNLIKNPVNKTEMKDLFIIEDQEGIKNIISEIIDTNSYYYGNIFSHKDPFTIHSDVCDKKKTIMLIPVEAHVTQKFIVFDQTINQTTPVSWIHDVFNNKTDQELKEMYYDNSLKSRPYEHENVRNLSNMPISNDLYQHLPYTKDLYFGLTGHSWNYIPGTALLFDANRIHATGIMNSPKIGCTIQFTESLETLQTSLKAHIQF
jgi:hypothetical protein